MARKKRNEKVIKKGHRDDTSGLRDQIGDKNFYLDRSLVFVLHTSNKFQNDYKNRKIKCTYVLRKNEGFLVGKKPKANNNSDFAF